MRITNISANSLLLKTRIDARERQKVASQQIKVKEIELKLF